MDEKKSDADGASTGRSEEEVAWDQEFKDYRQMGFAESLADMAKLAVKVPVAILQMPLSLIPQETARHTRAAVRETFLAFRSLLGAVGDGIEKMLADPEPTTGGPDGTWGSGPKPGAQAPSANASASTSTSTGGRARRIALSDDQDNVQPSTGETAADAIVNEGEDAEAAAESRGLRADIDY